jgi:hypothetical protein
MSEQDGEFDMVALEIAIEEWEEHLAREIAAAGGEAQYRAKQIINVIKFAVAVLEEKTDFEIFARLAEEDCFDPPLTVDEVESAIGAIGATLEADQRTTLQLCLDRAAAGSA